MSIGSPGLDSTHALNSGPHTYNVDGYRDLGFTGPMFIDVIVQPSFTNSGNLTQKTKRVRGLVSFSSFQIIFDNFDTNPSNLEVVKIDTTNKQVKITTKSTINLSEGHLVFINVWPSS